MPSSSVRSVHVQFAIDDLPLGEAIVEELLSSRMIACAQTVGPVTSRYWWQGSINEAQEWLFLCKTAQERRAEVIERIRARHPYDVPEIVAGDITGGLDAYLDWIDRETQTSRDKST
jgi:periplasmic divalent cation tolerance protein